MIDSPESRFEIVFVNDGKLLEEAQLLRGRVFFKKPELDQDKFDAFCQHLVIIDKDTGRVVGTYRLLLGSVAQKNAGFYSETEFDLSNIKKNCRPELMEMGRACVDDSYRGYPIINLLWKAILSYVAQNQVKYMFGCSSITGVSPEDMAKIVRFFKDNVYGPEHFRVYPHPDKKYIYPESDGNFKKAEVIRAIPSLIRGYLKMGAFVCGEPIWDPEFGSVDFFMMIDTEKMDTLYKSKFV